MTDELIERIKADPRFYTDRLFNDMGCRILADAKIIEAAEELARRVQQQQDGAPMRTDYIDDALTAYRAAQIIEGLDL